MTAFLTSIWLGEREAAALRLFDTYDWHQAAWKCFPARDDAKRDFLTRLDRKDGGFRLILVSPTAPVQPEWSREGEWQSREIPQDYFAKRRYRFQLRANPTKKLRTDKPDGTRKKNGTRVALTAPADLAAWLARKGEAGGFFAHGLQPEDPEPCAISPAYRFHFHRERDGHRGVHSGVDFTGILEVTDPARFHETFRLGIGSAKAFGFGLLVIAPL
jgi:CRISPR system Cascade subunit CasE